MNKGRVNTYLVTGRDMTCNGGIFRIIKGNHDGNPRIEVVRSQRVFTSRGLVTLIQQNKNRGYVYVFKDEFSDQAIKLATDTGIPFWIISMNNGGWTSSCINRVLEKTRIIAYSSLVPQVA